VKVAAEGDKFALSAPGLQFNLPGRRFPALGAHVDGSVCVGIRPQHIRLGSSSQDDRASFSGVLMVTEQLGDEQLIALRVGAQDIRIAGIDPDLHLPTGAKLEAAVAADHLHLFDASTGRQIG